MYKIFIFMTTIEYCCSHHILIFIICYPVSILFIHSVLLPYETKTTSSIKYIIPYVRLSSFMYGIHSISLLYVCYRPGVGRTITMVNVYSLLSRDENSYDIKKFESQSLVLFTEDPSTEPSLIFFVIFVI